METSSEVLVCQICSIPDPLCLTKLGIPLCSSCWKKPGPSKNTLFHYDPEIDKITDKVFLGNEEASRRIHVLKALGITNILVAGRGLAKHYPNDFEYKCLEIDDFFLEDISVFFEESFKFIEGSKGNVYVHCAAGVSRSATIVISYLMRKNNEKYEDVFEFVKERRPSIGPNEGFVKQLRALENQLKNTLF